MSTAHKAIRQAVVDVLRLDPPVADGGVFANRRRSIGADKSCAVVVRLERSSSQGAAIMGGRTCWDTLIAIECYGRNSGDDDSAADAVAEAVFARLDEQSALNGLAMDIEPLRGHTLDWDSEQFDTNMTSITARFVVKHQTNGRTLTL